MLLSVTMCTLYTSNVSQCDNVFTFNVTSCGNVYMFSVTQRGNNVYSCNVTQFSLNFETCIVGRAHSECWSYVPGFNVSYHIRPISSIPEKELHGLIQALFHIKFNY
jgi:hypothetical protein